MNPRRRPPVPAPSGSGIAAVYLLFLALPLAGSPTSTDGFLPLRLLVLGAGLALGLLARPIGGLSRPLVLAITTGVGAFILAAVSGATPLLSLVGRYPRYEGLPVVLGYAAALAVGARLLADPRLRRHSLHALAWASVVNLVCAAGQAMFEPGARVTGTVGNATVLGAFSLLCLAMLAAQAATRTPLALAGLAAAAGCLVLSASRGALLGGIVAALAAGLVWRGSGQRARWWWGPGAAAGLAAAAWLAPGFQARLSGATPFAEATVSGRLLLWRETAELIARQPWLGIGPSRFVDSIEPHHTAEWAARIGPYAPPDSPHNAVLQVLAATGVVGLVAVVGIGIAIGVSLWRARPWDQWQSGALLAAIAVGVSYLTSFTDPVTLVALAAVLGGAVAQPPGAASPRLRLADRAAAGGALVAALLLGGSLLLGEGRYSAALLARPDATAALLEVPASRPWDADLTQRVGYTAARLAEAGAASPVEFVAPVGAACARLPGSVTCLQVLADLQDLSGDHRAALRTLQDALAAGPVNVDTVLRQGIAHAQLAEVDAAEERFLLAAALRPSAAEPWANLAELYARAGRESEASAARSKAEQLRRR